LNLMEGRLGKKGIKWVKTKINSCILLKLCKK
jgi:hypothetical protein